MELSNILLVSCMLLSTLFAHILAQPSPTFTSLETYDPLDGGSYYVPYAQPISDYRLSRLRRGYYFVDNGYITAVPESAVPPATRRDDNVGSRGTNSGSRYQPVVSYKQQQTKHKKLFVPNLYG